MKQTVCISNTPPQTVDRPSTAAKCFALTEGNALVSVSAVISLRVLFIGVVLLRCAALGSG